jgi:class 3 adenylate cyclase
MIYAFGDCELDIDLYVLRRADQVVHLSPKVFQVLMYLLEHRDRVVDKDELCEQVWPEQFIATATLESTLRAVRQAVGDSGHTQGVIRTLHGHGYRFVAPLMERIVRRADAATQTASAPPSTGALSQPATVPPEETESKAGHAASGAEHRHLTVLSCDLVDSTALVTSLDPETLREVVRAYHDACAAVVRRFDGSVAQRLGESWLVYFGYPRAHEDDAQRAIHAGLALVHAMAQVRARLQHLGVTGLDEALQIRVGIDSGLVVVGEVGESADDTPLALGTPPHLAARLQGLAAPQTVMLSAATYRLVQGWFACQALGTQSLQGFAQPIAAYRVLEDSGVQSRLEVASARGLTPLVGREREVGLLLERWAQVKDGQGQVVVLSGEAGIGKSRLVQVVKEHVAGEPHVRWECRGSLYHQHSAMYPVIDLLQRALRVQRDDTPLEKLRKLEDALAAYGVSLPKVVPLLASLLSVLLRDNNLSPEEQKQQTMEALVTLLLTLAARQPVLIIVEDLHWVDPSTLELLSLLIGQVPAARVGVLLTCRPEFRLPWGLHEHLTLLTLGRLSSAQAEQMVEGVTRGKTLPAAVREQIITKTDGVPLFVEELTTMVLESEWFAEHGDQTTVTGSSPLMDIPATLYDSLIARLDRLGVAKVVAQLGAVLGRTFPYELLQAVAPFDAIILQRALAQLVEAGLLLQRGLPPQVTYIFKHALIQQAAYQALLHSTRRQHHQRIAQVLAARFPEIVEMHPELLAQHYTEAGWRVEALPYWQQAGQRACERSAYAEAVAHFTTALEALKTVPEMPEHPQLERALQAALDSALLALKGHTHTPAEQV